MSNLVYSSEAIKTGKPKIRLNISEGYTFVNNIVQKNQLHTVCEEARCPNIYECWENRTATIMILGDKCTRACGFCSVKTEKPTWNDPLEPIRTAQAVKQMNLRHVVITSVDRDDLKDDYGAGIWAETILAIRDTAFNCTIETLIPDLKGRQKDLETIFNAKPDILGHNLETVYRLSKSVRPQSNYERSLNVLEFSVSFGLQTKSSIMVGLGETKNEIFKLMEDVYSTGCSIFTIGQYLQPTNRHLPVKRYVHPHEFKEYRIFGEKLGFKAVLSGPRVRSSYLADKVAKLAKIKSGR